MKSVSRFEAVLLGILRGFLGRVPMEQVLPLLVREHPRPRCLSRACVDLIQDTLAKGATSIVAREGWQRERFLRGSQAKSGRLWERTAPAELGLLFSRQSLELLLWLTAENVLEAAPPALEGPPSVGDRLLFLLAVQGAADAELESITSSLGKIAPLAADGLFALANPTAVSPEGAWRPDFTAWLKPPGSCILEAWQSRLARAWLQAERGKRRIVEFDRLRQLGQRQDLILSAFLEAAEQANRRDLARFLLVAARGLLADRRLAEEYFQRLDTHGQRMADRAEAYHLGLSMLRHFQRLAAWQQEARSVAHYEEEYEASQLWKSDWEALDGDASSQQARLVVSALQPLRT